MAPLQHEVGNRSHQTYGWTYGVSINEHQDVAIILHEDLVTLTLDYLTFAATDAHIREALVAQVADGLMLTDLLMFEITDMKRVRSDRYGMYLSLERRAEAWAKDACRHDYAVQHP